MKLSRDQKASSFLRNATGKACKQARNEWRKMEVVCSKEEMDALAKEIGPKHMALMKL